MWKSTCTFSNYKVGSAVEVKSGEIIGGCNIESSSYGLTCCAEELHYFELLQKVIVNLSQLPLQLKMLECLVGMPTANHMGVLW